MDDTTQIATTCALITLSFLLGALCTSIKYQYDRKKKLEKPIELQPLQPLPHALLVAQPQD